MSHDRGCSCGREKYEYSDCPNPDCAKRSFFAGRNQRGPEPIHTSKIQDGKPVASMEQKQVRRDIRFGSTKRWTHDRGLSVSFRQWKASSHCRYLHGYALQVEVEFTGELDEKNWVVDFGGLKDFKAWLDEMFDHKTVVAEDDPCMDLFTEMKDVGMIDLVVVPNVGCEAFALMCFNWLEQWLKHTLQYPRVKLERVEVREHASNSAFVERDPVDFMDRALAQRMRAGLNEGRDAIRRGVDIRGAL
jgi:6-pyruvoyltetrahydropterin/6-carboxytetrahydropterin synthase